MKKIVTALVLALIATAAFSKENIAILHGPYLQNLTESEVTIVWVSNNDSVGWVEIAPDDGSHFYASGRAQYFDSKNGIKTEGRIHSVKVSGLAPGTSYRYRVVSKEITHHERNRVYYGRVAYSDVYKKEPLKFTTCDPSKPAVSFAMVNDIHGNNDRLRALMGQCDFSQTDQVIFLGDMASIFNSEEQVFQDFMDTAVELFAKETPMYYTRGNHETRGNAAYHFQDYFSTMSDHIYYMYRQGPVCFVALDCGEDKPDSDVEYYGINVYDQYRSEQAEWLEKIVQTEEFKSAPFKIVTCHMPPFDGWHGEQEIKQKFLPILDKAGIDILLCGHLHNLQIKQAGECASFPIIVNSNNTLLKCDVTADKMTINITDENANKVQELVIDKR